MTLDPGFLERFGLEGEREGRVLRLRPAAFRWHELVTLEVDGEVADLLLAEALVAHPLESCWAEDLVRGFLPACGLGVEELPPGWAGHLPWVRESGGLRLACRELPGALGVAVCPVSLRLCPGCHTPLWPEPSRCGRCGRGATWLKRIFG